MGSTRAMGEAAAAVLILSAGLTATAVRPAVAQAPARCAAANTVRETLPNGTTWQLCWRIHARSGLVLEDVRISSRRYPESVRVLRSVTLAQLNVPYDSGETEYNDITDYGFGGEYLQTLAGDDCRGGSARVGSDGDAVPRRRKVLCVSAEASGPAYRLRNDGAPTKPYARQGHDLVLRTVSKVSTYEYIAEYRLHDDGEISARLGATGDLSPVDVGSADNGWPVGKGARGFATSHYHSAFWRVDFDLAGRGGEQVEQYDTRVAGRGSTAARLRTSRRVIAREGSFSKANRRWWRVVSRTARNADGHARSYELVTAASDVYEAHPETTPDVTFTQHHGCEKYATDNTDPQCAAGRSILDYARNAEIMTNPVMWVRVGFHHVPRDEDQSPMPLHWQGFDLVPRDFTEVNRLAPEARAGFNGRN
ncbi:primary-amine oxidase [Actinoplanes sp. NPDC049118]|uniref:copper amine oxidase n=1 Tax=Actinoplanes sp. NPDC049118 TaxID=3155769 RepID=UPI0033D3D239